MRTATGVQRAVFLLFVYTVEIATNRKTVTAVVLAWTSRQGQTHRQTDLTTWQKWRRRETFCCGCNRRPLAFASFCPNKGQLSLFSTSGDSLEPGEGSEPSASSYDLGLGKNRPFADDEVRGPNKRTDHRRTDKNVDNWVVPDPVQKPPNQESPSRKRQNQQQWEYVNAKTEKQQLKEEQDKTARAAPKTTKRMVARDNESQNLRGALWDEHHFDGDQNDGDEAPAAASQPLLDQDDEGALVRPPSMVYPNIDMSIPDTVFHEGGDGKPAVDVVWDNLRWEAYQEAQREPLLVSFLYSTILNHKSLESSLAFLLANRLQSPAMMMSTQLQSIILDTLQRDATARRYLRADMMAVRDRDPACHTLPDVFLYFKGFHALQSHRVAHVLWKKRNKHVLASYLQSQVSQVFQIDIHPNATLHSGIMLDHGTGIVIGSTARVGHNCSILHHVTLGGSGKKGVVRHPSVQDGVLLGAGATVLGPVTLGEGSQVGAGTLVITDLPPHCVAVGVPARIIGSFIDVTEQPSVGMNQMIEGNAHVVTFESEGI